jgi:phospholipid/cholesterol/gamma-HCH transport system permease protein
MEDAIAIKEKPGNGLGNKNYYKNFWKSWRGLFEEVTGLTLFTLRFFKEAVKPPYEINEVVKQCYLIGYKSLLLIAVTGFIMGFVLTVQSRPTLAEFGAQSWLPAMVSVSIVRELGPVITALIFAGKVGSGIGAEIASMKVTEQVDAMEVSGVNPFKYLLVTRIAATTLMLPLLAIMSDVISLSGAYIAIQLNDTLSFRLYFIQIIQRLDFSDVFPAFIKTFFFGFAVGLIGCYKGFNSNSGTEGVGTAANAAVIIGSLAIFIIDMIAVQIAGLFM